MYIMCLFFFLFTCCSVETNTYHIDARLLFHFHPLLSSRLLVFSLRFPLPLSFSSYGLPRCRFVSSLFGNISSFILTCTCPGHVSGAQFCQLSKHQFQFVLLINLFPFTTVSLYTMCSRNPVTLTYFV